MRSTPFLAAVFAAALALPAAAQNPPDTTPTRIRGTVDKLDGQTLLVKSRDGQSLSIALAPNFAVLGVVAKSVSDIKPSTLSDAQRSIALWCRLGGGLFLK